MIEAMIMMQIIIHKKNNQTLRPNIVTCLKWHVVLHKYTAIVACSASYSKCVPPDYHIGRLTLSRLAPPGARREWVRFEMNRGRLRVVQGVSPRVYCDMIYLILPSIAPGEKRKWGLRWIVAGCTLYRALAYLCGVPLCIIIVWMLLICNCKWTHCSVFGLFGVFSNCCRELEDITVTNTLSPSSILSSSSSPSLSSSQWSSKYTNDLRLLMVA